MAKEEKKKSDSKVSEPGRFWAATAYLIFFLPLIFGQNKSSFVRFHARQGLGILVTFFVTHMTSLFLHAVVSFLQPLWSLLLTLADLGMLVLVSVGIYNALSGFEKQLPLIGGFADRLLKL